MVGSASKMEDLASKLDGKVVVSLDEVNWEEADKELQWAVLIKWLLANQYAKTS